MLVSFGKKSPVTLNLNYLLYACPNRPDRNGDILGTTLVIDDGSGCPRFIVVDEPYDAVVKLLQEGLDT